MSDSASTPSKFRPGSWAGQAMGSLSFLSLIRDLSPVELYGLLGEWVEAYALLVRRVTGTMFGWIDWRWIELSEPDGHILILAGVLTAALARAGYRASIDLGEPWKLAMAGSITGACVSIFLPILILVLVLPGIWGLLAGAIQLTRGAKFWTFGAEKRDGVAPDSVDFRREVVGTLTVFAVLILANYVLF